MDTQQLVFIDLLEEGLSRFVQEHGRIHFTSRLTIWSRAPNPVVSTSQKATDADSLSAHMCAPRTLTAVFDIGGTNRHSGDCMRWDGAGSIEGVHFVARALARA